MAKITSLGDDALIALDNLSDAASSLLNPTLRLGVTGLSRAGKTVFITSLVHNLLNGGRLPLFDVAADGRLASAHLEQQPDDDIPRFQYEKHVASLIDDGIWPQSTRNISELRLKLHYESASAWNRTFGPGTLTLDIVDYPGEWLLDLPLLGKSYAQWSREALSLSRLPNRKKVASDWHKLAASVEADGPPDELTAQNLAAVFTQYLRSCREDQTALSTLPPGRFLMPGELEGSPALTFAPLELETENPAPDTFHAMMERRYESYKSIVVKPFFREHFARIDRQIVLVDALQALNAGGEAITDLETALSGILECFNHGKRSWLTSLISTRTDRILFAATKADHLHHENHDRLEALLSQLVEKAIDRARFAGAQIDVVALAAIRSTREAEIEEAGTSLPLIVGVPKAGEKMGKQTFDGKTKTALFPGDLPKNVKSVFEAQSQQDDLNFVRFNPPVPTQSEDGLTITLPHIRLDRSLQFLLGDLLE